MCCFLSYPGWCWAAGLWSRTWPDQTWTDDPYGWWNIKAYECLKQSHSIVCVISSWSLFFVCSKFSFAWGQTTPTCMEDDREDSNFLQHTSNLPKNTDNKWSGGSESPVFTWSATGLWRRRSVLYCVDCIFSSFYDKKKKCFCTV